MDMDRYDWYGKHGEAKAGTEEIVVLLESILRRGPDHLGANHFHVHLLDTSPNPDRTLASANRLTQIAPGAGHIMHMWAHLLEPRRLSHGCTRQ
jgi:hypothetical protein